MKIFTLTTTNFCRKPLNQLVSNVVLILVMLVSAVTYAQPTVLGTQAVAGTYTAYNLTTVGGFKQVRLQATSGAASGARNWEFAQGTAAAATYTTNWRPNTANNTISVNNFIPTSFANGARYNTGSGGSSGLLPAITASSYYTFNVSTNATSDNVMSILETTFNPTTVSSVTQSPAFPVAANAVTVTVTMSASPNASENVFVRYTTDNFVTTTLAQCTFVGAVGTATIPAQAVTTNVKYYVYSSNRSSASIGTDVTTYGQGVHDMSTLNLNNNAGANYSYTVAANNVQVTSSGGTASAFYATLGSAFTAINAGTHTGTVAITILANLTETVSAVLNASGSGSASYTTLSVQPSGGAARTITGAIAAPLIDLNGADNVTINGLNTGGNSLTISNTSTAATAGTSTIRFIADATVNTVQNCTITGSSTLATSGTIFFSTGTATGNITNTITANTITSAGTNLPFNCIYSFGTSSFPNTVTVTNNSISDWAITNTSSSAGIWVGSTGNTGWTITGNKLFQSVSRVGATNNSYGIEVLTGNGYTISSNVIGYANSSGTGTFTVTSGGATKFVGIELNVLTATATEVQGNTIAGINLATTSGAASSNGIFTGISVITGKVNVGQTTANIIGASSGTGSIVTTTSTSLGLTVGINATSTSTVVITGNTIGGISALGTAAAVGTTLKGIQTAGTAGNYTINSNIIGNTTANNMVAGTLGTTTATTAVWGIQNSATGTIGIGAAVATGNTVQNLAAYSTSTGTTFRGIESSGGTATIAGNTIKNITSNSTNTTFTSGGLAGIGIYLLGSASGQSVSSNTINTLSLTNTTSTGTNVTGISITSATSTLLSQNRIYDLSNASTSITATTPGTASGIFLRSPGTDITISNNMISLGNAQTTNTTFIGIWNQNGLAATYTTKAYFNSLNIEGAATSGAQPSFAFLRGDLTATIVNIVDLRNNIMTNTRSGGTGKHYAIANDYGNTASSAGWGTNASNYNVLNGTAANIGYWGLDRTFGAWQTASASDANSYSGITVTFTNSATGDLHLNMGATPTALESNGVAGTGTTVDYDGQTRPGGGGTSNGGGTAPDLGADEFNGAPLAGTVTLGTNNIAAGNITQGTINNVLYSFSIAAAGANTTLTGLSVTTNGTYASADVTNLKVYYSTGATFVLGSSTLLSTFTTPGVAGLKTFPSFVSQSITTGATGYIYITSDIPCAATVANTIAVNAVTNANTTFSAGTVSGTPAAGNTQTIAASTLANVGSPAASVANASSVLTWINPTTCFDEILIIASPAANTGGTPTGNGTAYPGNLAYGSGTTFGNGFVVYKGSTSPQTVTGLTNGTSYFYKFFTRFGSTWSSGLEVGPIVPAIVYCTPSTSSASTYISNVTTTGGITNLNNTSVYTTGGYVNYTGVTPTISQYPNTAVNFSVTIVGGTAGIGVFVDWNNNGVFTDAGENVYNSAAFQATGTTSSSFTVPSGQAVGNYRMRVVTDFNATSPLSCSFSGTRGEAEDYTFTVSAAITPTITSLGSTTGCVGTSITINGTNLTGATAANVKIGGTAVSSITSNSGTVLVAVIGAGTTGTVTVTTGGGTATSAATFTVNPSPTASWAATATTVCFNAGAQTTSLGYTATTNTPVSYSITWNASPTNSFVAVVDQANSFNAGSGTITLNIPAGTAAGTYTGTISVKNANGCVSTGTQTFTITVTGTPTTSNAGLTQTICATGTATLAANSPTVGTGAWTIISGPSLLTSQFSSLTSATALFTPAGGAGAYVLTWTISNSPCAASASNVTINVSAVPTTSSAGGNQTICTGATATLAANTPTVGTGAWSVTGPSTLTSQFSSISSPTAVFTPAGGAGTYTLTWTISNAPCTSTSSLTLTVNATPSALTITPAGPTTFCDGGSVSLTASGGTALITPTLGSGSSVTTASTTASTLGPNPMQSYYGGSKQQMIVTASELSGLGMISGSVISSLAFNMSAVESRTLQNYVVKIQNTALTAFASTTFVTAGFTTVRNAANLIPVAGWNTIPFNTNYTWNGTSNLLIEVNFSNNDAGGTGTNTAVFGTTSFASTLFYRVDSATAATVDAATTASFSAYSSRNNMQFGFIAPASFVWSPSTALNTTTGATVTANPTYAQTTAGQITYTATSTVNGCSANTTSVITVNPKAAITAMTNSACSGVGFTSTPTNGTNGTVPSGTTYSWLAPAVTGGLTGGASGSTASSITGTLSNPTNTAQTATYTVTPTSGSCTGANFTLTVTVNPKPAITAMTNTACSGIGFTSTPTNGTNGVVPSGTTYSWLAPVVTGGLTGGASGSGASSITGTLTNPTSSAQTATYTVTPTSGSCAGATFTITVTINAAPSASTLSGTTTICTGSSTNLQVAITGGATPYTVVYSGGTLSSYTSGSNISVSPTTTTTYTLTSVTDANGCVGTGNVSNATVTVTSPVDYANLQFPSSGTICTSGTFTSYGQVYKAGVTEAAGQGAGITVWVGYDSSNTNPSTWTNWVPATFNVQSGNNDEYTANISGLSVGTYYYAYRYQSGVCGYQYGGYSGTGGNFWDGSTNVSGVLTVSANNTAGSPSSLPTLCVNTAISPNITIATTGATGISNSGVSGANGLPSGVSATWSGNVITISGTPTTAVGSPFSYSIPLTGGCGSVNAIGTITVTPAPTTATNTSTQTICGLSSVVLAGNAPSVGTGSWSVVSGPSSNTSQFSSLTNPTATFTADGGAGSYVVRWTISNSPCTASTADATVTVGPTKTWTGSSWSPAGNPSSTDAVLISSNYNAVGNISACTLTVNSGALVIIPTGNSVTLVGPLKVNSGSFTLENNAYLLQTTNAANTGNIIVKTDSSPIIRLDYTLWSSPVTGQGLYAFSPYTFSNRFYRYLESSNLYNSTLGFTISPASLNADGVNGIDSSNILFATAKGYLIRTPWNHPTASTVWYGQFTGVPNNGDKSFTLELSVNDGLHGYNAVGNPYPSPISIASFLLDNYTNNNYIESTLWFWRKTNDTNNLTSYVTFSGSTYSSGPQTNDDNIQPGQGFIVKATTAGTFPLFKNTQRVATTGRFFRNNVQATTAGEGRIWLKLQKDTQIASNIAVGYKEGATNDLDAEFDGKYINDSPIALTSFVQGQELAVQHRAVPFSDNDIVPLSFKTDLAGTYSIVFNAADGVLDTQDVYIEDLLLGQSVLIKTVPYTFTSEAGNFPDRFRIVYLNPLGIDNPTFNPNQVVIYKNEVNEFVINSGNVTMSSVKVFDIRGRLLMEKKGINASQTTMNVGLANEVLLVQITSVEGEVVTKKVIR